MTTVSPAALIELHRTLRLIELVGVTPEEREMLLEIEAGRVFVASRSDLAEVWGVSVRAFQFWADHDPAGVLRKAPFSVRQVEQIRRKMLSAAGGRARLCQGDMHAAIRRRALRHLALLADQG